MAGDKDAKIEKARQLAESGKFVSAISAWRELLDETPHNDANVYNTIGDLCLKNKATSDAIEAYSKAARFYLQEGFHLKAIALYKKILKLDPNRAEIYTLLGDLNVVRGLMNNAVADYLSGAKLFLKIGKAMNALTLFRKITKVDPQNTDMRLRVAELCLKEKLTDEAIDEYLRIGLEYRHLGRTEEASKLYEQILKISPGHKEAQRRLDNPLEPVAQASEPAAPVVEEITVADTVQAAAALEAPAVSSPASSEAVSPAVANDFAGLETLQEADAPVVEAATVPAPAQPAPAPAEELTGTIEFTTEGLTFEPHDAPSAQPSTPLEVEVPVVEVEVAAPSLDLAEPTPAVAEAHAPIEAAESAMATDSAQATGSEFEAIFEGFRKGIKELVGDEEFETHYDLGFAYKEMGLIVEAIEEFQLAARGPTRFVDACTMIAACYRDQNLGKSAITFLERVLADDRCAGPGVPYVKYDLAVLYEDEGFEDKAILLYEGIPSVRDVEARLRRLRVGEEPPMRPSVGTEPPISYL